jgi:hypothetical protein
MIDGGNINLQDLANEEEWSESAWVNIMYQIEADWEDESGFLTENVATYRKVYPYVVDNDGVMNLTFHNPNTNSDELETAAGLYTRFHKPQIEMLKMRDRIITAKVNLTVSDISKLNFRKLVVINNNKYIISKIKDYKPNSGELTEVELVLVTPRGSNESLTI